MNEQTALEHDVELSKTLMIVGGLILAVVIVPIVGNFLMNGIATVVQAFQPKRYKLTLTFEDGSIQSRMGTKKELEAWMKEMGCHIAAE